MPFWPISEEFSGKSLVARGLGLRFSLSHSSSKAPRTGLGSRRAKGTHSAASAFLGRRTRGPDEDLPSVSRPGIPIPAGGKQAPTPAPCSTWRRALCVTNFPPCRCRSLPHAMAPQVAGAGIFWAISAETVAGHARARGLDAKGGLPPRRRSKFLQFLNSCSSSQRHDPAETTRV
jgi:hypothetical protein